jgi:hypothetical protein
MNVYPVPHTLRVAPSYPVEQVMRVDGRTVRVAIQWAVIEHWLGARAADAAAVQEILHSKREEIERTVEANLFAQGMPLSGEVTLTLDDFRTR